MMYLSKKEEEEWVIVMLVSNHNHELASPQSQKFLRSKRKKSKAQKNLIDILENSGIRLSKIASVLTTQAGGVENLNLTGRDIQNYLSTKRQNYLEKGDAQLMLKYFQKRQSNNPEFFYAIQMDVEGHLAYVRCTFYAGMSTTQRRESMNKYFKNYLNSSTLMSVFVKQYAKIVDARHVLMVFIKKQIHSIPPCYLLDRWIRYAIKEKADDISNTRSHENNLKSSTIWVNNIMMHSLELFEQATQSEKHYKFAYHRLLQLCEELDELPYEEDNDNVCDSQVNESNLNLKSSEQGQDIDLLDPPCVATKGRPNSLRRKGGLKIFRKAKKSSSQKQKRKPKITKKRQGNKVIL
ncbi:hypothetical protein CQW23_05394 [Capsicum baccatum]|uniref:Uncharacterized protein n=1 Tax=Capsicum baccatum TaxID=33114 RepID=A0A2G2XHD9_CAPBA|nr:hypothetical protein CQW23_05394 [Capsicum baccatum]